MKGRPKPHRMRKPYKRKTGGTHYMLRGGKRSPKMGMVYAPVKQDQPSKDKRNPLKALLEKMGFNVKH